MVAKVSDTSRLLDHVLNSKAVTVVEKEKVTYVQILIICTLIHTLTVTKEVISTLC